MESSQFDLLIAKSRARETSVFRWTLVLSAVVSLATLGIVVFGTKYAVGAEARARDAEQRRDEAESQHAQMVGQISQLRAEQGDLQKANESLLETVAGLRDFVGSLTEAGDVHFFDPAIQWTPIEQGIASASGQRQIAVLGALMLAWKQIPWVNAGESLGGFDSPRFIRYVLSKAHVKVPESRDLNVRLTDEFMKGYPTTETPLPGDLMFFAVNDTAGNFGLIYLGPGDAAGKGVGVGMGYRPSLGDSTRALQVLDTKEMNAKFHFLGYYRPPYGS